MRNAAMAKPTIAKLNQYIQDQYNPNYGIHKGAGYFYFFGVEAPSIYVCHLNHLNLEQWKAAIDSSMQQVEVFP
jgi:hypothetical protein